METQLFIDIYWNPVPLEWGVRGDNASNISTRTVLISINSHTVSLDDKVPRPFFWGVSRSAFLG